MADPKDTKTYVNIPKLAQFGDRPPLEYMKTLWRMVGSGQLSVETGRDLMAMAQSLAEVEALDYKRAPKYPPPTLPWKDVPPTPSIPPGPAPSFPPPQAPPVGPGVDTSKVVPFVKRGPKGEA